MSVLKYCEGCGRGILIQAPLSAKLAEKYCNPCKPSMERSNRLLGDYSTPSPMAAYVDHLIANRQPEPISALDGKPHGTDLTRRQRQQLAWADGFSRNLKLEQKQQAMKLRIAK